AESVVCGLVLCTVPEVTAALDEARRVLAPGGEARLMEHVRAGGTLGRVADRIAPAWGHFGGGCRPNQDTEALLAAAGFDVSGLRTSPFPPLVPIMPMLSGSATPVGGRGPAAQVAARAARIGGRATGVTATVSETNSRVCGSRRCRVRLSPSGAAPATRRCRSSRECTARCW